MGEDWWGEVVHRQVLAFTVVGNAPSQNAVYKRRMLRTKGGAAIPGQGMYMTEAGKTFKDTVYIGCVATRAGWQLEMTTGSPGRVPVVWEQEGEFGVEMRLYYDSRRPDINNSTKLILDALEGAAYKNDRQVSVLIQRKFLDRQSPRVEIAVWRIP